MSPGRSSNYSPRTYSHTEFTALRARVKGPPIATIARLYFDLDENEPLEIERLLWTMRDDLVSIALCEGTRRVDRAPAGVDSRVRRAASHVGLAADDHIGRQQRGEGGAGSRDRALVQAAAGGADSSIGT